MNEHRRLRSAMITIAAILLSGLLATSSFAQENGKRKPAPGAQADGKGKPDKAPGKQGKADKGKEHAADKQAAKAADKAEREEAKEAKAAEREEGKEAKEGEEGGEAGAGAGGAADPRLARIKRKAKDRRERRAERGKEMRERARTRAGAVLAGKPMDQAFKQELLRHARRMARLNRVMAVAAEAGDVAAVERATKLLAREAARHRRWTDTYAKDKGGKGARKGGQP